MEMFPEPPLPPGNGANHGGAEPPNPARFWLGFFRSIGRTGRLFCAKNPFYVYSTVLVCWGLVISYDATTPSFDAWKLLIGLCVYVLLLSAAASFFARFGPVWDDVRNLLLLVVLLLLWISASFDVLLAADPFAGGVYLVVGLVFAATVSELLLYFTRLWFPAGFRVPYYLMLTFFFLYPLAVASLTHHPSAPALHWVLFSFCPFAGAVFLTLLPAAVGGPGYTRAGGGPWQWPYYPWVLFAVLSTGVLGRSYYLCYTFQFTAGEPIIFAPYFWVPFLWILNVLLVELALHFPKWKAGAAALVMPAIPVALAAAPPLAEGGAEEFFNRFVATLDSTPLFWAILWTIGHYFYAVLRKVPYAALPLAAAVLLAAFVRPETAGWAALREPHWVSLVSGGALWVVMAWWKRESQYWALAAAFLIAAAGAACRGTSLGGYSDLVLGTLLLAALLVIGAVFDDLFARALRRFGFLLIGFAGLFVLFSNAERLQETPQAVLSGYAIGLAAAAVGYRRIGRNRAYYATALVLTVASLVGPCRYLLGLVKEPIPGLKYLAWGAVFFIIAVLISLIKSGLLRRPFRPPGAPVPAPGRPGHPSPGSHSKRKRRCRKHPATPPKSRHPIGKPFPRKTRPKPTPSVKPSSPMK